ncbi:MAG: hypothetical protein ACK5D5_02570 [Bacteroidota bacterium]|jgi:hypothetical protein
MGEKYCIKFSLFLVVVIVVSLVSASFIKTYYGANTTIELNKLIGEEENEDGQEDETEEQGVFLYSSEFFLMSGSLINLHSLQPLNYNCFYAYQFSIEIIPPPPKHFFI